MAITISVTAGSGYAGSTFTQTGAAGAGNWYGNESAISGATASTFVMDTENEGKKITFRTSSPAEISNIIELFIPSDIPGLTHWYDAYADENLTLATAAVTTIANRVGGGASLGQATTGNKPSYSATGRNSKPAISFDGTDDYFTFSDAGASLPNGTNPSTVFTHAFFANVAGLDWRALSSWGAGGSGTSRLLAKSNIEMVAHTGGSAGTDNKSSVVWQGADKGVVDEQQGTVANLYIDGNTTPTTKSATYNSGTTTHAYIGRSAAGQYWQGSFQEYGVFNVVLNADNQRKIEGYLHHKWGTTSLLPGGHPYKSAPPYAPNIDGAVAFGSMVVTGTMSQPNPFSGSIAFADMIVTGVMAQDFTGAIAFDSMVAAGELAHSYVGSIAFGAMEVAGTLQHKFSGSIAFNAMEVAGTLGVGGAFVGAAAFGNMVVVGTMTAIPHYDIAGSIAFADMVVAGTMSHKFIGSAAFADMSVAGTMTFTTGLAISGAIAFDPMEVAGFIAQHYEFEGVAAFADMIVAGELSFVEPTLYPIVWDEMIVTGTLAYVAPEIIVEDGSIVAGAESYIDAAYATAYALARGVTLPSDVAILKIHIIKAMDYIERQRAKYKGRTASEYQYLSFPRSYLYLEGSLYPQDQIPTGIKQAQALLTMYSYQGIDLEPVTAGGGTQFLVRQKLGPIEREYSEAAFLAGSSQPSMFAVNALLAPFLNTGSMAVYRA